jgi:pimeloyl-ACP methyl ester carboxylesterase
LARRDVDPIGPGPKRARSKRANRPSARPPKESGSSQVGTWHHARVPAVFVHGNPESDAIWRPLLAELDRDDVICLTPPGFGAPVPDGFGATRREYADWLVGELEAIEGDVDLVGHDWGGGHVMGAVALRPELVRSWACDVLGLIHPSYVWHDLAQIWRKPGEGEAFLEQMLQGPVEPRVTAYEGLGMTPEVARDVAEAAGEEMGRCVLALYRSAPEDDLAALGEAAASTLGQVPGLAIVATDDPYVGTEAMVREMAEKVRAQVTVLEGVGHWWMCQNPSAGAAALQTFWSSLPSEHR